MFDFFSLLYSLPYPHSPLDKGICLYVRRARRPGGDGILASA